MKTAQLKNGDIVIENIEKLTLDNKKGAIVKVFGCGLCGSDIVKYRQHYSNTNSVIGHEIVGEIVEINSKTKFKLGDKIVSSHHIPCFNCAYCKSENYSMCEHFKSTNIFPGGFSEYIYLTEEHLKNVATLIPKNLSELEASYYEPLGCCVRAVKRGYKAMGIKSSLFNKSKSMPKVLVIGLGTIGLLMGQALKAYYMDVYACDLIDDRITLGAELGLKTFNSKNLEESIEYIKKETKNLGFDAVYMTSGASKALEFCLKSVRNGGTILVFSSIPESLGYLNNDIYYRELTVLGSYSPAPIDLKDSMELLKTGKVKVKGLSTEYNLEQLKTAIEDTVSNKIMKAYIKTGV